MVIWPNRQKSSLATASVAAAEPASPAAWYRRKNQDTQRNASLGKAALASPRRRFKSLELFSLAVVIGLIVGVDLYIFGINKRLSALEDEFVEVKAWAFPASLLEGKYASLNARVRTLTEAFSGLDSKVASLASQERQLAAAPAPVPAGDEGMAAAEAAIPSEAPAAGIVAPAAGNGEEMAESTGVVSRGEEPAPAAAAETFVSSPVVDGEASENATPELTSAATQPPAESVAVPAVPSVPAAATAPADSAPLATDAEAMDDATAEVASMAEQPLAESAEPPAIPSVEDPAPDEVPAQVKNEAGPWVINLLSDPNAATADRFANRARDLGIAVQQNEADVKGRTFFRVQLTGFATAKEAQAHAAEVKEKLHLKEVWIFKQRG